MFTRFGPDTGFDCVYDGQLSQTLVRFLDRQNNENALCRTVLYTLNPTKNSVIASVMGCFQKSGVGSYIQFGSAWWFNDHIKGIEEHLKELATQGVLSCFIGMLTDSRSFLSYPRHEYFRRILCNLIGEWVENGEYPSDIETLSTIIKGICYENAVNYFKM
jgi:glucuronate isomerase